MEEHNDEDELKQVCSKLFKLNNKDYFQAEFDVAPHKLKNYIDFRDKLKKL